MTPLLLHRYGEGIGGFLVAFGQGCLDHPGINCCGLPGLAVSDRPEGFNRGGHVARHAQVVDAVLRLGDGHFLKNPGDLRVAFLHCALSVGVVLQVGQRLGDNGAPKVLLGGGKGGRVSSHRKSREYSFVIIWATVA